MGGTMSTLTGYPVLFHSRSLLIADAFFEQIAPSFADHLADDDQFAVVSHDTTKVLGRKSARTLTLTPDRKGIRAVIDMPNTSYARDLAESHARGDVPAWSFSFRTIEDRWELTPGSSTPLRTVTAARLIEVSPGVAMPAYPATASARGGLATIPARRGTNDAEAVRAALQFLERACDSRNLNLRMIGRYDTSPPRMIEYGRVEPRIVSMQQNRLRQRLQEVML
jgi:uncharacterized protein